MRWSDQRNHLLASGCNGGQVLLWDVRRARSCLQILDMDYISKQTKPAAAIDASKKKAHSGPANGISFCDDGVTLVTFGHNESKMRRWDILSGRNMKTPFQKLQRRPAKMKTCLKFALSPSFGHRGGGLAFVPDGSNIAVVDVDRGNVVDRLRGHYNGVSCVIFDASQQQMFSAAGDRNIFIWDSDRAATATFEEHLRIVGDDAIDASKQNFSASTSDDEAD